MPTVLGLLLGAGSVSIWLSCLPRAKRSKASRIDSVVGRTLQEAGIEGVKPQIFLGFLLLAGVLMMGVTAAVTASLPVGVAMGILTVLTAWTLLKSRVVARRRERAGLWPEVVDQLTSAIRAGLGLPEALVSLEQRAPEDLRAAFGRFAAHYRSSQRFDSALNTLKETLADPVADRLIESIRMTYDVGGSDVTEVLTALSSYLREDQRFRGELLARQSWTVNGAKLAVVAPWIILLLMSTRGNMGQAFNSVTGIGVLVGGAAMSVIAYLAMVRLGRLPLDKRVLR